MKHPILGRVTFSARRMIERTYFAELSSIVDITDTLHTQIPYTTLASIQTRGTVTFSTGSFNNNRKNEFGGMWVERKVGEAVGREKKMREKGYVFVSHHVIQISTQNTRIKCMLFCDKTLD